MVHLIPCPLLGHLAPAPIASLTLFSFVLTPSQVIHARSGGAYEIMGLMQGKVVNRTFCVMDSFALPVQGTETRVNAQEEASGYMIQHMEGSKNVSRSMRVV